jgi:putative SOS response-associated peptidase YedK
MCTRYIPPDQAAIEAYWRLKPSDALRWPTEVFPRLPGPFLRAATPGDAANLVLGQWGLIPWFAKTPVLKFATNNARFEGIEDKASYKSPWQRGQRCIIPAASFDEPCWETGRNVWWRFRRADGTPWGLAGLWNVWRDPATGRDIESYTMLTINADQHPIMRRMHKPDPKLAADQQDKRSVVAIEADAVDQWLHGTRDEASALILPPDPELTLAAPASAANAGLPID